MITLPLGITDIKKMLPHRAPFLLIDKVTDLMPYESCTAYKAVSYNEWFFKGHFPEYPVMPGVLIIEAMAQTAGVLTMVSMEIKNTPANMLFAAISNVRFRKQVIPGDLLCMKISVDNRRSQIWKFKGVAYVEENIAAEAEFTAMVP